MGMAYEDGLTSILVEGGQKLASAFLEYKLVNRLYLFYGNVLVGNGIDGVSFSSGLPLNHAITLSGQKVSTIGTDILVTGIPQWK
jgi:diaminohydroxyphosphoribosylaminopyrimidine deaminase/5-amino-6-(5-phosphoribosylamino)uracil reductase